MVPSTALDGYTDASGLESKLELFCLSKVNLQYEPWDLPPHPSRDGDFSPLLSAWYQTSYKREEPADPMTSRYAGSDNPRARFAARRSVTSAAATPPSFAAVACSWSIKTASE